VLILYRHSPVIDLTGSDEEDLFSHPQSTSHIAVEVRLPRSHDGLPQVFPPTRNTPQSNIPKHIKPGTQHAHYPRGSSSSGNATRAWDSAQQDDHAQSSYRSPYQPSDSPPNPKRRKVTSQIGHDTSTSSPQIGVSTPLDIQSQSFPSRSAGNTSETSTYNRQAQERSFAEGEVANQERTIQERSRQNLNHVLLSQVFPHIQNSIARYSSSLTQEESTSIGQRVSASFRYLLLSIYVLVVSSDLCRPLAS
jgi:hypothetical protein